MSPAKVQSPQEKASADVPSQSTATLAEIARAAGVSAPTVSKVLNGRADVAPGTRTRVEGLSLVLSESAGRLTPGQTWVDGVLARRPVGVILVLSDLTAAQRAQLTS